MNAKNRAKPVVFVTATFAVFLAAFAAYAGAINVNADLNHDGRIDLIDMVMLLNRNLVQGDTNNDARVDIFDLAGVGMCFECKSGEPCWNGCQDAEVARTDQKIDIFDLATVGRNFGVQDAPAPVLDPPVNVVPSSQTIATGSSFDVNISIDSPVAVYAFNLILLYNPLVVNVVAVTDGNFLRSDGSTIYTVSEINNTMGFVSVGSTRMGTQVGVTGSGNLSTIRFSAVGSGTSELGLAEVVLVDTDLKSIAGVTTNNGSVAVSSPCTSHASFSCSDNDLYWFNSCGVIEDKKTECGSDSCDVWGSNYCEGGNVYHSRTCRSRGCASAACFDTPRTDAQQVESCPYGCSAGACVIQCSSNANCGTDAWAGAASCSSDDVFQNWRTNICNNAGTKNSYCSISDVFTLKQDCGTDYCGSFGSNYCSNGDVYHSRTCYDLGCSSGACFSNPSTDSQLVQDCAGTCQNGVCVLASTVGIPAGVNLFSLPLVPAGGTISFSQLGSNCNVENGVIGSCAGSGIAYLNPDTGGYVCLGLGDQLYPGQGYFIKTSGACSFTAYGDALASSRIGYLGTNSVKAGENLIGAPTAAAAFSSVRGGCQIAEDPLTFVYGATSCMGVPYYSGKSYCKRAAAGYRYCYCSVSTITPGTGYNVYSTNACNFQ